MLFFITVENRIGLELDRIAVLARLLARAAISLKTQLGRKLGRGMSRERAIHFQIHSVSCWQALIPCHSWLSTCCLTQRKRSKREKMEFPRCETQSFYNLILKVIFLHICCILFRRSKSLRPAHTQGDGIAQRHECEEVRIVEATLEAAYRFHFKPVLFTTLCWTVIDNFLELKLLNIEQSTLEGCRILIGHFFHLFEEV